MSRLAPALLPLQFREGMPLENSSHGRELLGRWPVKVGRTGALCGGSRIEKARHNESVSENLRLASVIDERFIAGLLPQSPGADLRPGREDFTLSIKEIGLIYGDYNGYNVTIL